jgi:hypothetical protein
MILESETPDSQEDIRLELQKSENTLKLSAFICVYLSDICGFCINQRLMQFKSIQAIQQGLDDFDGGRFSSFDEFAESQRRKYNLPFNPQLSTK